MSFQVSTAPLYIQRLVFDLTFFVIVVVILMNVIFGTVRSLCVPAVSSSTRSSRLGSLYLDTQVSLSTRSRICVRFSRASWRT